MEYSGWTLFDDVIFVCKEPDKETGVMDAFVVDENNLKQLETARGWARGYDWDSKKYKTNNEFKFRNSDFEFEIYDSANYSSQGGKLSFWSCYFKKDGKIFNVGVNSDLLLSFIRQSTIINGVSTQKVFISKCKGQTGILHKDMKEYSSALNDMETKLKSKKKTSKHIIGRNYYTLKSDNIYMGHIYKWGENKYVDYDRNCERITKIIKYEKSILLKLFLDTEYVKSILNNENSIKKFIYNSIEKFKTSKDYRYSSGFNTWNCHEKLPSRTEGDISLINDAIQEDWNNYFCEYFKYSCNRGYVNKDETLYSPFSDIFPKYDIKEKKNEQ